MANAVAATNIIFAVFNLYLSDSLLSAKLSSHVYREGFKYPDCRKLRVKPVPVVYSALAALDVTVANAV